jgi:hypothetical protein
MPRYYYHLISICNREMNNAAVGGGARTGFQSFCQYVPYAFCRLVIIKASCQHKAPCFCLLVVGARLFVFTAARSAECFYVRTGTVLALPPLSLCVFYKFLSSMNNNKTLLSRISSTVRLNPSEGFKPRGATKGCLVVLQFKRRIE